LKTKFLLAAWLLGSAASPALAGAPAPDLAFTELLQAPEGAKADWDSLRGKTVVVSFWATWCVPCVAEIPLMNALAAATDPAKVQFIAADYNGEDRRKIETFLKKHPISAWIGLDSARETQRRFDVRPIPITFVVGPDGSIAHVTGHPESLTSEQLIALADGKAVVFDAAVKADSKLLDDQKQAAAQAEQDKLASFKATNGKMLASNAAGTITLSEAARAPDDGLPADLARTAVWTPGRFDLLSARVQDLVAHVAHSRATRVAVSGVSTEKRYNLHVDRPGVEPKALDRAVERILSSGLGVTIGRQTRDADVAILAATAETAGHLNKDDPPLDHGCYFLPLPPDKSLICTAGSLGDLADAVEDALGLPVLAEQAPAGRVTAKLAVSSPDLASLSAILDRELGLFLTPSKRPIDKIIVSAKPHETPR